MDGTGDPSTKQRHALNKYLPVINVKWFLGILGLLVVALVFESGLLAYATYVLFGLLIISRWLARNWMESLRATRVCLLIDDAGKASRHEASEVLTADLAVEQDDVVLVRLRIRNESWLPVPWILLEDLFPEQVLGGRFARLRIKGKRAQIRMIRGGGEADLQYRIECLRRGYYQIGPLLMENGDLWGLHRRHKLETEPIYLLVYPRIMPLLDYQIASRRPIGDVRLTDRRDEDPTRIAGARFYEPGDPLHRVDWKATARTGQLHSKILEPSTLSGATLVLDFHRESFHARGEPMRSELAVTAAVSLANAVLATRQQVGLITNGRDAADRLRATDWSSIQSSREAARRSASMLADSDRLRPMMVETRRGSEQLQRIRETLARVELTDGLMFPELLAETTSRLPRDATVLAVLPQVTLETAFALGNLRRRGFAVTVVVVMLEEQELGRAHARLLSEGVRDVRHLASEAQLPELCQAHLQRCAV